MHTPADVRERCVARGGVCELFRNNILVQLPGPGSNCFVFRDIDSIVHFQIFVSHTPAYSPVHVHAREKEALARGAYVLILLFKRQPQIEHKCKVLNREYLDPEGICQFTTIFVNVNPYICGI